MATEPSESKAIFPSGWTPECQALYELVQRTTQDERAQYRLRGSNPELQYVGDPRYLISAIEILHRLRSQDFVLVASPPQTGKTLVMLCLRYISLLYSESGTNRDPALVPFQEVAKRHTPVISALTRDEVTEQLTRKLQMVRGGGNIFHLSSLSPYLKGKPNPYRESSKLSQWCRLMERALVMVDEGHMDRTNQSVLETYLTQARKEGSKVVFFTAEPNQFLISDERWRERMLVLPLEKSYYSLAQMQKAGLLGQAQQVIKAKLEDIAFQLVMTTQNRWKKLGQRGYLIIRCRKEKGVKMAETQKILCQTLRKMLELKTVQGLPYDQSSRAKINLQKLLSRRPPGLTVIFVKEMLRAGVTLDTRHILAMYDTYQTRDLGSSINSFFGRMCGYGKTVETHGVHLFGDLKKAQLYLASQAVGFDSHRLTPVQRRELGKLVDLRSFHGKILDLETPEVPPAPLKRQRT